MDPGGVNARDLGIAMAALGAPIASALFAYAAYKVGQRASRRDTFLRFQEEYDSQAMHEALVRVGDWDRSGRVGSKPSNADRRLITSYATRLVQLRDLGLVGHKEFSALAECPGLYLAVALHGFEQERCKELQAGVDHLAEYLLQKSLDDYERALGQLQRFWLKQQSSTTFVWSPPGVL